MTRSSEYSTSSTHWSVCYSRGASSSRRPIATGGGYKQLKVATHEAAFELIEIPHVRQSGRNSAGIRMIVDGLHLCYTKSNIDALVIGREAWRLYHLGSRMMFRALCGAADSTRFWGNAVVKKEAEGTGRLRKLQ